MLQDTIIRGKKIEFLKYGKNDFAERYKILLDTNMKVILLDRQNI